MEDTPPLSVDEAEDILFRIDGAGGQKTLVVGGQALAFWAEQLFGGLPPLKGPPGPVTSKDIDVMGGRRVLDDIADRLSGEKIENTDTDAVSVNTGKVLFKDSQGHTREIDVLRALYGVDDDELVDEGVEIDLPTHGTPVLMMHPVVCMKSRFHNYVGLGIRTEHSFRQLEASVLCAREYLNRLLAERGPRSVINWNKNIFQFCMRATAAIPVGEVDPFDSIQLAGEMPEMVSFREKHYPRMRDWLASRRNKRNVVPIPPPKDT